MKPKLTPDEIDHVMTGFVGRTAIREGWWWELHQYLMHEAQGVYLVEATMNQLRDKQKQAWSDAQAQQKMSVTPDGILPHLQAIWKELMERRAIVWQKYVHGKEYAE